LEFIFLDKGSHIKISTSLIKSNLLLFFNKFYNKYINKQ